MKILLVRNNVMLEKGNDLFIFRSDGRFLVELSHLVEQVGFFQFRIKNQEKNSIFDYKINDRDIKIISISRGKIKYAAYIQGLIVGFKIVRKYDFLYLYYPGNINLFMAIFAVLWRKPFGFYIRGEKGMRSRLSKILFRKAMISLTISPQFTEIIRKGGGEAQTIRPMMEEGEKDIVSGRTYERRDHYRLLYVGRVEEPKGSYDLVQAVKILKDKGEVDFSLDMVGDGADAAKIKQIIAEEDLGGWIRLHGVVSDRDFLKRMYRQADLFVLPTHHEGFPRVLYEAMIAGTPILTTFVGTIPYLMKDGYNCYRILRKNPEHIAKTIRSVLQDYDNKSSIAEKGTKTIIAYLCDKKERHAKQLVRILEEKGMK